MPTPRTDSDPAQSFITRWKSSGGAERANYQMFLTELCDLLEVQRPDPASDDNAQNAYVFERSVPLDNRDGTTTTGFIDLYRRQHFVCETKQGVERDEQQQPLSEAERERRKRRRTGHGTRGTKTFDDAMRKAYAQAGNYARSLPPDEGRPPFLVVVDVGHTIELYSEFSQTGGTYVAFPDPQSHKITIDQLADEEIRERLRLVWTDPQQLDPARKSAAVTREIAAKLAELAKRLETSGHHAEDVAHFLMRCLFTMFAEDVNLLPTDCFKKLLKDVTNSPELFVPMVEDLWRTMNSGGFSAQLRKKLLYFNGGLFSDPTAIELDQDEIGLLYDAATKDWRDVEPAIFGTLLERALDPVERHKLGAHYTPRAYVERLVVPTVVEPLREEWEAARTAAMTLAGGGDTKKAIAELRRFHDRLCDVRVLDPACGSGNFLYVVLEHLKRIEGEVLADLAELGETQQLLASGHTVDPHQLLGIEINPRAAAIAELVLWIGYLQWHFRTRGSVDPPQPVIKNFKNIECRDAVLDYTSREVVLDENNKPVTIWDGRTTKPSPITGEEIPDETARVPMYTYLNPTKAQWPQADFIVGNPPFVGSRRMRAALGDGYVEALRTAIPSVPASVDLVMYWWDRAATELQGGRLLRFGFVTTNSIVQHFNQQVLAEHLTSKNPTSVIFAIPDHPWVDAAAAAAVRISMTVVALGDTPGVLSQVTEESQIDPEATKLVLKSLTGKISQKLRVGADLSQTVPLDANKNLTFQGVIPVGDGFRLTRDEVLHLGHDPEDLPPVLRLYLLGRDIVQSPKEKYIIDFFGYDELQARKEYPALYQRIYDTVRPTRMEYREDARRRDWWRFVRPRENMRLALDGLPRYIGTPYTARHRPFVFLNSRVLPDAMVYAVASDDAFLLGCLSSRLHETWASTAGGRMGVGNDSRYNNTVCFEPFPFPDATESQKARIRELGEQLDAHRKRQQQLHPKLTMTGMYNVLEKLRSEEPLTTKEREIHEWGLVSVLRQIHDDLDAAVAEAYGWNVELTDEEILERLVALNHERAEEEKRGIIRWLRPEYQNPEGVTQRGITTTEEADDEPKSKKGSKAKSKATEKIKKQKWPTALSEQAAAVSNTLTAIASPADDADVAKHFTRANRERIAELLETLESLGKVRQLPTGKYVAI